MTIKQFNTYFVSNLKNEYPETEIHSFFHLLIENTLNFSRVDIALNLTKLIEEDNLSFLKKATLSLKKHKPIQYIIGESDFFGLKFYVNKNVLIPRPETEELVDWIINSKKNNEKIEILDIGTGSGCIAISLAKNIVNSKIHAYDISKKALKIAKKNALRNNVQIQFTENDILKTDQLSSNFDIIVSNPPYVRKMEAEMMKRNVLDNEPRMALFVENNNPLIFYNKIADLAKKYLKKNGELYFEINQYLADETVVLLKKKGFTKIELKKDFLGNNRMIRAQF